jgi:hypothetical protein
MLQELKDTATLLKDWSNQSLINREKSCVDARSRLQMGCLEQGDLDMFERHAKCAGQSVAFHSASELVWRLVEKLEREEKSIDEAASSLLK